MRKPADIIYGVNDKPPAAILILGGCQNVAVMAVYLIFPLIICREAGASTAVTVAVLSLSMLVMGVATLLQAARLRGVGSGYLCPAHFTGAYISPSLLAVETGGLPLVFGMTAFAGALEAALSRILNHLRPYFPPEIAGLVVMLVGVTNAAVSVGYLLESMQASANGWDWALVAAVTLGAMVGLNVWSRGTMRLICALIGIVAGYVLSAALGLLTARDFAAVEDIPIFALPHIDHLAWSFELALVAPFLVGALAVTLKAMAVLSICQKINDTDWIRPDLGNIQRGVAADGIGTFVAGVLGTFGINSSPSCVGLSAATGIAARRVAFSIAAIFVVIAVMPPIAMTLAVMPKPVIAAALMFTACFLLINGMQVITLRMLDSRKTFIVGLTIVAGLGIEIYPEMAADAPAFLSPIIGSSLVFGTVLAFSMNIIFRLGLRQRVMMTFDPLNSDVAELNDFLNEHGAKWGARRDVIDRASFALNQFSEVIAEHGIHTPIRIEASFDEFNLDLMMAYEGKLIELPNERPTELEILESENALHRLAGFMLRRNADRATSEKVGGTAVVRFHFEH